MKVLLAIDGSAYTGRMLDYLAAHAQALGPAPEFTVMTAVDALPPRLGSLIPAPSLDDYYDATAREILEPAVRFAEEHGWHAQREHGAGEPSDVIAALAQRGGHDLIVMGTHGHSDLCIPLGSTAEQVLARCDTPVLLVS
jgi:nucleotide-binding universal stress UspA family protein